MPKSSEEFLFVDKLPNVLEIYERILTLLGTIGPFEIEVKKTSIHLINKAAFGGVHPKKNWLDFNLVTNQVIQHKKLTKTEQVSKNRYHNNFRFSSADDIDNEFALFLKESYLLMGVGNISDKTHAKKVIG